MLTNTPHQLTDGPVEYIPAEDILCYDCERLGEHGLYMPNGMCADCMLDFSDGEPAEECEHLITVEYRNRQRECVECGGVA